MKNETNIERLATLSRIYVSTKEQKTLKSDIDSILSYVEQIKDISTEENLKVDLEIGELRNVMREDIEPHKSGVYTKELLKEVPSVKNGYIEVKKIIDQDK